MATRRLELVFTGDTRGLERAFGRASSSARSIEGGVSRGVKAFGKLAAAGVAAGAAVAGAFTGLGIQEAIEQEKVAARTANVLKTTGGVANVTKKQIEGLAGALQSQTGVASSAIQSSQNLLLTFTKVRNEAGKGNDIFTQGTKAALDMSVALGTDLQGATLQIGKALNDPIKGVTALSRAGVSFTQQQKDQIRTLVESGRTLDAQKLILSEMQIQFGGAAEAAGNTTAGQFEKLKRTVENAAEAFAVVLLPRLNQLTGFLQREVVPRATEVVEVVQRHWPAIQSTISTVVGAVVGFVRQHWGTISSVTAAAFEAVVRAVRGAVEWIQTNVVPTIASVVTNAQRFWDRFGGTITATFALVVQVIRRAMTVVRGVIETVLALIRGDWGAAWAGVKTVVSNTLGALVDVIRGIGPIVVKAMSALGKLAVDGIRAGLKGVASAVRSGVVSGVSRLGDLPAALLRIGRDLGGKLVDGIAAAVRSLGGKIKDAILSAIPDSISIGPVDIPLGGASGGFIPGTYRGRDDRIMRVASGEAILTPRQQAMIPGGRATLGRIFSQTGGRIGGSSFRQGGFTGPSAGDAYQRAVGKLGTRYVYGKWDCADFATYVAGVDVGGSTASAWLKSSPARGGEALVWGFRRNGGGTKYDGGTDEHMGVGVLGPDGKMRWFDNTRPAVKSDARSAQWQALRVPKGWENVTGSDDTGANTANEGVSVFEATRRALAGAGVGKRAGAIARRVLGATGAATTGVSESLAGGSLRPGEDRAVSRAGRAARTAARKVAGISPEEVAARGEEAERKATVRFYQLHVREIDKARRLLRKRKAQILRDIASLPGKKKEKNRKARATKLALARATIDAELKELGELRAEANEQLAQLREQRIADDFQEDYDARGETVDAPTEADYLDAAVAQAELTPGTDDDLAAAQAVEAYAGRQYQAALESGDPRQIAESARALAQAQQNRAQIEALRANTDAVNANTEAVSRSFGGSVSFGYRGQDYVLRSLAPPSSDRLDASLLGV